MDCEQTVQFSYDNYVPLIKIPWGKKCLSKPLCWLQDWRRMNKLSYESNWFDVFRQIMIPYGPVSLKLGLQLFFAQDTARLKNYTFSKSIWSQISYSLVIARTSFYGWNKCLNIIFNLANPHNYDVSKDYPQWRQMTNFW